MMDQDQQRDYAEEQYNRNLCPECDHSPCIGEVCTGEPAKPERAVDGWLESLRSIRAVLDSVLTENEKGHAS